VNIFDTEALADTLYRAIHLTGEERRASHATAQSVVRGNNSAIWGAHVLETLREDETLTSTPRMTRVDAADAPILGSALTVLHEFVDCTPGARVMQNEQGLIWDYSGAEDTLLAQRRGRELYLHLSNSCDLPVILSPQKRILKVG